jgi:hypothetical protein
MHLRPLGHLSGLWPTIDQRPSRIVRCGWLRNDRALRSVNDPRVAGPIRPRAGTWAGVDEVGTPHLSASRDPPPVPMLFPEREAARKGSDAE